MPTSDKRSRDGKKYLMTIGNHKLQAAADRGTLVPTPPRLLCISGSSSNNFPIVLPQSLLAEAVLEGDPRAFYSL